MIEKVYCPFYGRPCIPLCMFNDNGCLILKFIKKFLKEDEIISLDSVPEWRKCPICGNGWSDLLGTVQCNFCMNVFEVKEPVD